MRRQALTAAEARRGPAIRILRSETVQHRLTRADRGECAAASAQWHDGLYLFVQPTGTRS